MTTQRMSCLISFRRKRKLLIPLYDSKDAEGLCFPNSQGKFYLENCSDMKRRQLILFKELNKSN